MQIRVAYQGVCGAYSYIAAKNCYPEAEYLPCATFDEVFAMVQEGQADLAIVPVENSYAGRVADVHFLLAKTKLYIYREYFLRIEHQLIGLKGCVFDDIKFAHSHQQALSQCSLFLSQYGIEPCVEMDTAISCRKIIDLNDGSHAAIASKFAAEENNLQILASNIENTTSNTTRFLVMGLREQEVLDNDGDFLVSLMFKTKNECSALYKALRVFAQNEINLIKIESYMPEGRFVSAQFYVELETHTRRDACKKALQQLRTICDDVAVLGVYEAYPYRKL